MKQKVNLLTTIIVTITLALTGCAPFAERPEAEITVTLPPIGGESIRAIAESEVARLQAATASYRVRANQFTRTGTETSYKFFFAAGTKVDVTVECLNSSGQVIVRTGTKSLVVTRGGDNSLLFTLSKDGTEIVHGAQPEPDTPTNPDTPDPQPSTPSGGNDTPSEDTPGDTDAPKQSFTVTYDVGSGPHQDSVQGFRASDSVPEESSIMLPTLSAPGYDFAGWLIDGEIIAGSYMPAQNVTATAQWTLTVVNITFNQGFVYMNGTWQAMTGAALPSTGRVQKEKGSSAEADSAAALDHVFKGWVENDTQPSGGAPDTQGFSYVQTYGSDMALFGIWEKIEAGNYEVKFERGGENVSGMPKNMQETAGASVTFTETPTRIGYDFTGWRAGAAGTQVTPQQGGGWEFTMPGESITLTAEWQEGKRTVLYDDGVFVINELPENRRRTVNVIKEYAAMKDDGGNYVFGSSSNVPWYNNKGSIKSVEIGSDITPTSTAYWFYHAFTCASMDLTKLDTSRVTDMKYMFYYCLALTSLDVSKFVTSSVTDMKYMFYYCNKLTSLDVSRFDTSSVTDMRYMFAYCSKLASLDVSRFDTSRVTSMDHMFRECSELASLDVSRFDTSSVTDMRYMFAYCKKVASLDVSRFDTSSVTTMQNMFYDCYELTSLDVSRFDTSRVTNMWSMFCGCKKLASLDVSSFDTSRVTDMKYMFSGCSELTSLDLSSFDTSRVTDMTSMFYSCSKLAAIYAGSSFVTASVTSGTNMFSSCSALAGGQGTRYSSSNKDATYARIDGGPDSDTPGYFTQKP